MKANKDLPLDAPGGYHLDEIVGANHINVHIIVCDVKTNLAREREKTVLVRNINYPHLSPYELGL